MGFAILSVSLRRILKWMYFWRICCPVSNITTEVFLQLLRPFYFSDIFVILVLKRRNFWWRCRRCRHWRPATNLGTDPRPIVHNRGPNSIKGCPTRGSYIPHQCPYRKKQCRIIAALNADQHHNVQTEDIYDTFFNVIPDTFFNVFLLSFLILLSWW